MMKNECSLGGSICLSWNKCGMPNKTVRKAQRIKKDRSRSLCAPHLANMQTNSISMRNLIVQSLQIIRTNFCTLQSRWGMRMQNFILICFVCFQLIDCDSAALRSYFFYVWCASLCDEIQGNFVLFFVMYTVQVLLEGRRNATANVSSMVSATAYASRGVDGFYSTIRTHPENYF